MAWLCQTHPSTPDPAGRGASLPTLPPVCGPCWAAGWWVLSPRGSQRKAHPSRLGPRSDKAGPRAGIQWVSPQRPRPRLPPTPGTWGGQCLRKGPPSPHIAPNLPILPDPFCPVSWLAPARHSVFTVSSLPRGEESRGSAHTHFQARRPLTPSVPNAPFTSFPHSGARPQRCSRLLADTLRVHTCVQAHVRSPGHPPRLPLPVVPRPDRRDWSSSPGARMAQSHRSRNSSPCGLQPCSQDRLAPAQPLLQIQGPLSLPSSHPGQGAPSSSHRPSEAVSLFIRRVGRGPPEEGLEQGHLFPTQPGPCPWTLGSPCQPGPRFPPQQSEAKAQGPTRPARADGCRDWQSGSQHSQFLTGPQTPANGPALPLGIPNQSLRKGVSRQGSWPGTQKALKEWQWPLDGTLEGDRPLPTPAGQSPLLRENETPGCQVMFGGN